MDELTLPSPVSNKSPESQCLQALKALRLCCRAFAILTPPYLYRDLWLYMEEDSFARLKAVASHPKYRLMVRVLKIFPKLLSSNLLIKEDYEECVKAINFTGDGHEQWGFDANGNRNLSHEQLDDGFAQYTRLCENQQDTLSKAQDLLSDALSAFAGLRWVTPGFVDELLNDDTIMSNPKGKIPTMARTTHMAVACEGWQIEMHDWEDSFTVLAALASSECKIYGLNLVNDAGAFDAIFIDLPEDVYGAARKVLRHVRSLSMQISTREDTMEELHNVLENDCCANFLGLATNIEDLRISCGVQQNFYLHLEHVFGTTGWSNLRYFFVSAVWANLDQLHGFMERHRETLEDIQLHRIILESGSWKKVFAGMRGRKALKRAKFNDLWTQNLLVKCDSPSESLESMLWREEWQALLDGFIFGGKDWPSELDAVFSVE